MTQSVNVALEIGMGKRGPKPGATYGPRGKDTPLRRLWRERKRETRRRKREREKRNQAINRLAKEFPRVYEIVFGEKPKKKKRGR